MDVPLCEECSIPTQPYANGSLLGTACKGCEWSEGTYSESNSKPITIVRKSEIGSDIEELKYRNSVLEGLMNKIQLHREVTMYNDKVLEILDAVCVWSYAHRRGNGTLSDEQVEACINKAFTKLAELALS